MLFAFNLDSITLTDTPKSYATDVFETTEIKTTNHPQPNVSTNGYATSSRVSTFSKYTLHSATPLTALSSTKTNLLALLAQSRSIPLGSITSSKQSFLTTVSPTLHYTTPDAGKATSSFSPTQSDPQDANTVHLTPDTTGEHLNVTHYQTAAASQITYRTPLLNTTFSTRSNNTSSPSTYKPSSASASNKPSSLNKRSKFSTLFDTTFFH